MKLLLAFCVILLHHSLISCRTIQRSALDSPNEDTDSPTEEIANLLIPLIEKTLEKNSKQRARNLIQMLPYNESIEAPRWSSFNKKRVVEIMPLRRKQRRGEKPLAYLVTAPQSETGRGERRKGLLRRHEIEDIDMKHKEHELDINYDSHNESVEAKSHEDSPRKDHSIQKYLETKDESNEHSSESSISDSSEESNNHESRNEEALDYDTDDDSSPENSDDDKDDDTSSESASDDGSKTVEVNASKREEPNDSVISESDDATSDIQERASKSESHDDSEQDSMTEDTREVSDEKSENQNSEDNFSLDPREETDSDHDVKSGENIQTDQIVVDSDDSQYWGENEVSFESILNSSEDSNRNGDNNQESLEPDSNRSSDCRRLPRVRGRDVSGKDRRHEHKSYRLSFLFNR